jgi:RNA polymerase sigma-70 factor (ECF subfamily)
MKTKSVRNPSDEQLIRAYLDGDNNSLGIIYKRYYEKVFHKCLSFCGNHDDAFDLAQDILMKTFSQIETFKGSSKFSTWLFVITTNHCISNASRSRHECCLKAEAAYPFAADDLDDEERIARQRREDLESRMDEFLLQLPENDRRMLTLKYRMDYSIKDLQREFRLTASAVKMRLLRARNKMGQIILDGEAA